MGENASEPNLGQMMEPFLKVLQHFMFPFKILEQRFAYSVLSAIFWLWGFILFPYGCLYITYEVYASSSIENSFSGHLQLNYLISYLMAIYLWSKISSVRKFCSGLRGFPLIHEDGGGGNATKVNRMIKKTLVLTAAMFTVQELPVIYLFAASKDSYLFIFVAIWCSWCQALSFLPFFLFCMMAICVRGMRFTLKEASQLVLTKTHKKKKVGEDFWYCPSGPKKNSKVLAYDLLLDIHSKTVDIVGHIDGIMLWAANFLFLTHSYFFLLMFFKDVSFPFLMNNCYLVLLWYFHEASLLNAELHASLGVLLHTIYNDKQVVDTPLAIVKRLDQLTYINMQLRNEAAGLHFGTYNLIEGVIFGEIFIQMFDKYNGMAAVFKKSNAAS